MSTLKKECGNCYHNGIRTPCVPVEVPAPNFAKLDAELARLDKQEAEAEAAEEAAFDKMLAARSKRNRLKKQRKLLQRRQQQLMENSSRFVEEVEALDEGESINREVSVLESGLMPGTPALDWAMFTPSWLEGDPLPTGVDPLDLVEVS
jgi:hypothetical protein